MNLQHDCFFIILSIVVRIFQSFHRVVSDKPDLSSSWHFQIREETPDTLVGPQNERHRLSTALSPPHLQLLATFKPSNHRLIFYLSLLGSFCVRPSHIQTVMDGHPFF